MAHFALRATNVSAQQNARYAILDAETGHGYPPGITPAGGVGAYLEMVVRGQLDLTTGPDAVADHLAASEGDVFGIPVPAGTAAVEFVITTDGAADAGADSAMRLAFVPIGDDGSVVVDPVLMPSGPQPGGSLTKTVGMVGRTALALVLVAGDRAVSYTVEARAISGAVNVAIDDPTATNPYRVASPLEPMIVTARPTIDGDLPISLDTTSFAMMIGGLDADISSVVLRDGAYRFEANIPNSLGAGTHPVRLAYAGTEVDVPGGVTIDAAMPPREYQIGSVTSGPISQGATTESPLVVAAGAGTASFSAQWLGSEFDLVLTAPSGRVIDEASTDPDVTVTATANTVEISVASPEPGEWTLEAIASDVPEPEPVTLSAAEAATPVHGELLVESGTAAGQPVTVSFALADDVSGVQEATVLGTVTDPSGQALRFELRDDGAHDDAGAGDGLYATTLWSTTVGGEYQIAVDATGRDVTGGQLMRHGSTAITLLPMVDTDGDGVSDAAESAFGTDPADPADAATDHDGDGLGLSAELGAGLDPRSWDTDGGGESDPSELSAGRDPRLAADDAVVPAPSIGAQPADGRLVSVSLGTA
ncbi:MAG: choice-of-anchor X domain-containing protein, partial [Candidatus Limnocylindria bacterium]